MICMGYIPFLYIFFYKHCMYGTHSRVIETHVFSIWIWSKRWEGVYTKRRVDLNFISLLFHIDRKWRAASSWRIYWEHKLSPVFGQFSHLWLSVWKLYLKRNHFPVDTFTSWFTGHPLRICQYIANISELPNSRVFRYLQIYITNIS